MATPWTKLQTIIADAEQRGIEVAVALIGPDNARFEHRSDERFLSASTIKIAIMIALFRKLERGEISLENTYTLKAEDKTSGHGVLQHLHNGLELTIGDVVYLMMSISDNPATNILIDLLGLGEINTVMYELGLKQSVLKRKVLGHTLSDFEQENVTTANDLTLMIEKILNGAAASFESCEQMIALLEEQQNTRRIGRHVPEFVRWGSKTGSYTNAGNQGALVHDAGFIESTAGRMIISVLTTRLPDMATGEKLISDIAHTAMIATGIAEPLAAS